MKKQILHLGVLSRITEEYYDFINRSFDIEQHDFVMFEMDNPHNVAFEGEKVMVIKNRINDFIKIIPLIYKADKIYFHGLFLGRLILLFFFDTRLLEKCSWIIWGGGLTHYAKRKKTVKSRIHEIIRRRVIKNMGSIITHIAKDYKKAQEWYKVECTFKQFISHPYQAVDLNTLEFNHEGNEKLKIVIANSADIAHKHEDIMSKLSEMEFKEIEVICPLSYAGNERYIKQIINIGNRYFGTNFTPIRNFMDIDKYKAMMKKVDVGIYAIKQQGALGNIMMLLGYGKKVYIEPNTPHWDFLSDNGFIVFDYNDLNKNTEIRRISYSDAQRNIELCHKLFSYEAIVENWRQEFESDT